MLIEVELVIDEEYDSLVTNPLNTKQKFPVFVNPEKSEIQELAKSTNSVRFLAHKGKLHVWDASVLHAHAIKHLGLSITSTPPISHAFLGIAKPNYDGTLSFKETNQKIPTSDSIQKHHSEILHYFK